MAFGKSLVGIARTNSLADLIRQLRDFYLELATDAAVIAAIRFDGTVATPVAFRQTGVAASVTKLGTGNYRITFSSPQPTLQYGVHISSQTAAVLLGRCAAKTATNFDVQVFSLAGTLTDSSDIFVTVVSIP
jgi:hypothetical protein